MTAGVLSAIERRSLALARPRREGTPQGTITSIAAAHTEPTMPLAPNGGTQGGSALRQGMRFFLSQPSNWGRNLFAAEAVSWERAYEFMIQAFNDDHRDVLAIDLLADPVQDHSKELERRLERKPGSAAVA